MGLWGPKGDITVIEAVRVAVVGKKHNQPYQEIPGRKTELNHHEQGPESPQPPAFAIIFVYESVTTAFYCFE